MLPKDDTLSDTNKKFILKYLNDGLIGKAGKGKIGKTSMILFWYSLLACHPR